MRYQIKKSVSGILLYCIITIAFIGCGKEDPIEIYRQQMNTFYEQVNQTSASINSINVSSNTATNDMLGLLDDMNDHFRYLAAISVPEEYADAAELSETAAAYMNEAVTMYHQAFEGEVYDETLVENAKQRYESAMIYLEYIGKILQGAVIDRGEE